MTVGGMPESNCLLRRDPGVFGTHDLSEYAVRVRQTGVLAVQGMLIGVQPDAASRTSLPDAPLAVRTTPRRYARS